jgi:flagellar assembly protein FliH
MSKPPGFKNIPPPAGSKAGTAYTRFIPREELGDFASWQPDPFAGRPASPSSQAAPAAPAEPDAAEWQARVAAARQAGYQDGYRDGLVALENFKQTFAQQATAQVGALLDAFDSQLTALDGELAHALARTAVQLAQQVLRSELAQRPELVAQVAAEAVNAVMLSARHISVHVHPHDLPLVAEGAEEALAARGARLQADPAIERGGVRVDSDVGSIDARIAVRWAQAAAALGSQLPLPPLSNSAHAHPAGAEE